MPKLNIQGLARRDEKLMSSMLPEPGHSFVSVDLSSGEPTVTTHYSGDKNYADACFNLVNKEPHYDENGYLKIDDIYLTAASFSPIAREAVRGAFNSCSEQRNGSTRDEFVARLKSNLKSVRELHKVLVLGIGYSMGPKKMVKSCFDKGYSISLKDAKQFYNAYWQWCPKVRELADHLEAKFKRDGYLVNDFCYRLVPDASYKAFNYWIQSSVSGIVNVLIAKFFPICPFAEFVTVIHDELIFSVPTDRLPEAKTAMDQAVDSLNDDLNWTVKIRVGWQPGHTLYHAK
jgi:DNA polymerase I-like protein with 3'-5' exonuclease and polymerase domains